MLRCTSMGASCATWRVISDLSSGRLGLASRHETYPP
jgi:hypothetical protein